MFAVFRQGSFEVFENKTLLSSLKKRSGGAINAITFNEMTVMAVSIVSV